MAQRYDVIAARKYRTRDGEEKTAWTNVGVAFQNKDGQSFSISLHCMPVPDKETGEIRLRMSVPRPREGHGGGGGSQGGYAPAGQGEDDIPF